MRVAISLNVQQANHLGMGWAGDEGARAEGGCEVGLPLCSVAITSLSGVESDTKLLK